VAKVCEEKKDKILLEAKKIEKKLFIDLPENYKEFFVTSPDFLNSALSIERIRKKDIELYKNLIFSEERTFELTSPIDENIKQRIHTIAEYEKYTKIGYFGYRTKDIAWSSFCYSCIAFFEIFKDALYIEDKVPFHKYFLDLPHSILRGIEADEIDEDVETDFTIREFIENNTNIEIKSTNRDVMITMHNRDVASQSYFYLKEVLQADFSGEGNNESILFIHHKSEGSFNFTYYAHVALLKHVWVIISA
jgi:hypothetical protein